MEIYWVLGIPLFGGIFLALWGNRGSAPEINAFFSFLTLVASALLTTRIVAEGPIMVSDGWFFIDSAFDVAATHITGAIKISSLYTATNARGNTHVWEHLYFLGESQVAGQPEILTVTARSIGGGGTALARLDYEEYD